VIFISIGSLKDGFLSPFHLNEGLKQTSEEEKIWAQIQKLWEEDSS
jgi:hypothetical protein